MVSLYDLEWWNLIIWTTFAMMKKSYHAFDVENVTESAKKSQEVSTYDAHVSYKIPPRLNSLC